MSPNHLRRKFTLADAMILIASLAIGLALARVAAITSWSRSPTQWFGLVRELITGEIAVTATVLTIAVIPLRLQKPFPPIRRAATQPGMVAAYAALVVWLITVISWSLHLARVRATWPSPGMFSAFWLSKSSEFAPAVAAVWFVLALQRRWRRASDWVDWYGRALGVFWLTVVVPWPFTPWLSLVVVSLFGGGVF
jgi:hypothetical protein